MDAILKLKQYLMSRHIHHPFDIWLQKPHEQPMLLFRHENDQRLSPPLVPQPFPDEKYSSDPHHDQIDCYYYYPNLYVLTLCFPVEVSPLSSEEHEQIWLILYLLYHVQLVEDKQKKTEKLIEGIRSISSSLDLNDLLKNLVRNALEVINAADAGIVHLFQPEMDRLVSKGVVGFDEEKMQHFKLKVGESIAGKVFEDGKARTFDSLNAVFEGMNDMSEENLHLLQSARDLSELQSLICVPVSIADEVLGTMSIHKFRSPTEFSPEDLFLLQGFASQAAIAIQNARLYTQMKTTLEDVARLSEQLKAGNQFLLKRNEIHHELTSISLQNKGLEPIVHWLNQTLDRRVWFYDYIENKVYPQTIPNHQQIDFREMELAIIRNRSPFSMNLTGRAESSFFFYPIWVGSVILGFLMVDTKRESLSEIETITLEQSSSVLALELVKQRTVAETYYKKTHEYFRELLENHEPEIVQDKAKEFGITSFAFGVLIILEMQTKVDLQQTEADIHRLILRIKNGLSGREKIIFGYHHQITLLINLPDPSMAGTIMETVRSIVAQWEKETKSPIFGGIGSVIQGINTVKKSYEEAKKALAYAIKTKKQGLLFYEELGVNRLFLNHSQQEMEKFVEEIFGVLRVKENENYLEHTLRVYMSTDRSVGETAQILHIHINTLYQRLKKIEELLDMRFTNVEDVLKLQLACYLKETQIS